MERTKKQFDAVALMGKLRDQMSAEMEGMDYEQQKRYLRDRDPVVKESAPLVREKDV